MPLSIVNSTRQKPRYSLGGVNEENWSGHAADHDALAVGFNIVDVGVMKATFVIGSEVADVINVGIQLNDSAGVDSAEAAVVIVFLSDASSGLGIAATAPSGGVVIGTDGAIIVSHVTNLAFLLQSEADGDIDIDITHVGIKILYLVVVFSSGAMAVSAPIVFG